MLLAVLIVAFLGMTSIIFVAGWGAILMGQASSRGQIARNTAGSLSILEKLSLPVSGDPTDPVADDELQRDLRRAGYYMPNSRQAFNGLRNALVILTVMTVAGLVIAIGPENQAVVIPVMSAGALLAVFLWSTPRIILALKAKFRVARVSRGLPDALDMLSICMYCGQTLEDSLDRVTPELSMIHPDLAGELVIIRSQAKMQDLGFAFEQFADRIDSPEIEGLKSLVAQDQRLGSGIGHTILQYSDSMRNERKYDALERTNKATIWLLLPIMGCLAVGTILMFWAPAIVELALFLQDFSVPQVNQ